MKKAFIFLGHLDLRASLEGVIQRFFLPTILVIILSGLWFYSVNSESTSEWLYRSIIATIVTFFFSTGLSLFFENISQQKYSNLIVNIVPLLFGGLFYGSLTDVYDADFETITYIILTLSGFIAFVFTAPFLSIYLQRKGEDAIHFYNYFVHISWVFLISGLVGISLIALGFIAIGSVMALFDIRDLVNESKLYGNWAITSLALIAPIYGLIQLPKKTDFEIKKYEENKFFSFLVRYVSTPFIYVYFIILYTYSIKVLSHFSDWPKGIISWMVIGFSSFGYLIYIFSKAYESESKLVTLFRKYFAIAVLPQVYMLFYAIYLRITQYDITINRYFVVVFGVWLSIISLYYVLSQSRYLSMIPSSLLVIILIISIGPWSVYNLPLARQYSRLISNLEQAHILQEGIIIPLSSPKDISKELSNEIYSEISYICDFGRCNLIKELFKKEIAEATIQDEADWKKGNTETDSVYRGMAKWTLVRTITEKIKVQADYTDTKSETQKYIQYNTNYQENSPYPLTIDNGYTKIVQVYNEANRNPKFNEINSTYTRYPYITINPDTSIITYHQGPGDILSVVFVPPLELSNTTTPTSLEQKDLTFIIKDVTLEMKLLLQNYAIKNPEYTGTDENDNNNDFYTISGIGLIKEL